MSELAAKLARRNMLNEGEVLEPQFAKQTPANVYIEFQEFSRKEIKDFEKMFEKYDVDKNKYLDINELKIMMEKLEAPQTHLGLKGMIKEVDEDFDGQISFREFLLIFKKARSGELDENSGLCDLARLAEVNVDEVGVGGAKDFFEAKIQDQVSGNKYEQEIRQEQEERRAEQEAAAVRLQQFKAKARSFEMLD